MSGRWFDRGVMGNRVAVGFVGLALLGACNAAPTREPSAGSVVLPQAGAAPVPSLVTPSPLPEVVPIPTMPVTPLPETTLPEATRPAMRARPISGGTLAVLSDGHTAVAADSDRDQVYVVDLLKSRLAFTIALREGDEPGRVVEDDAGRVHVALRGGGAVVTLDPARGTILARRALCAAPRGLAYEKATGSLHVACAGGELVSIDAAPSATTPRRVRILDRDLRDIVVQDKALLVSTFRSANLLVVDAAGTTMTRLTSDATLKNAMSPAVAWRMVGTPQGGALMLHEEGETFPVDTSPGGYGRGFGCGGIVNSDVTVVSPGQGSAAGSMAASTTMALAGALVGADVAISPAGDRVAVVSIGGGDQGQQLQFFPVFKATSQGGFFPGCVGATTPSEPDAQPVVVEDGADLMPAPAGYLPPNGEVVAVAYDPRGNVIVQSREPASLQILTQRLDAVVLSTDSRFDAGHQLFHTATASNLACVSCHPEGGEDGRVWQFQNVGSRRTQSLRGGVMNTAPFHWSGDQNDMTSLMKDVFQGRMGGGEVDGTRLQALATWLNQIPTIPVSHWADDATVARGKSTFASAGCAACHAGRDFTNGVSVDVGTGGLFQVPQLHGLGFRAPYMHDGCASTLKARFSSGCGGDVRHGATSILSQAQIGDVIAYLDTL
jgi:cytochrome c553